MPRHDIKARRAYDLAYIRRRRADPTWRAKREWPTPQERFWAKVEKTDTCWLWTGGLDKNGYGRAFVERRQSPAHRLAYEWLVGPIPEGLVLDHLCRVERCVNPKHLEPVTSHENTLRGVKARALASRLEALS